MPQIQQSKRNRQPLLQGSTEKVGCSPWSSALLEANEKSGRSPRRGIVARS